jgi:hypothetical protein
MLRRIALCALGLGLALTSADAQEAVAPRSSHLAACRSSSSMQHAMGASTFSTD